MNSIGFMLLCIAHVVLTIASLVPYFAHVWFMTAESSAEEAPGVTETMLTTSLMMATLQTVSTRVDTWDKRYHTKHQGWPSQPLGPSPLEVPFVLARWLV